MYNDQRNKLLVEELQKNIFEEKQNNIQKRKVLYERLKSLKQQISKQKKQTQIKKQEETDAKDYNSALRKNLENLKKKFREFSEAKDLQNLKYSRLVQVQKRKLAQNGDLVRERSELITGEEARIRASISESYAREHRLHEDELAKLRAEIQELEKCAKKSNLRKRETDSFERVVKEAIESKMFEVEKVKRDLLAKRMDARVERKEQLLRDLEGHLEVLQTEGRMKRQILESHVTQSNPRTRNSRKNSRRCSDRKSRPSPKWANWASKGSSSRPTSRRRRAAARGSPPTRRTAK